MAGAASSAARRDACVREAHTAGATAAATALVVAGVAVAVATRFAPTLHAALSASSATALVVTPAFGAYFLNSHLALSECARRRRS
jgi:multidrug efflux pump subunit AcrB